MSTTALPVAGPRRTPATRGEAPEPRREAGVLAWLWYGVSAGLLAVILGIAVVAIALPRLTGSVPLTVLTESMEPHLPPGTLLVVTPLSVNDMDEIKVGDVISYQPYPLNPMLITHRVVGITEVQDGTRIFTTKGDANASADAPVREKQVRAKLWYSVPGLGWVNNLVNGDDHRAWIIPIAAGLLFAYAAYTVVAGAVGAVRRKKAKSLPQDEDSDGDADPTAEEERSVEEENDDTPDATRPS